MPFGEEFGNRARERTCGASRHRSAPSTTQRRRLLNIATAAAPDSSLHPRHCSQAKPNYSRRRATATWPCCGEATAQRYNATPSRSKATTSGCTLATTGDAIAQSRDDKPYDWTATARNASFGVLWLGPANHLFWGRTVGLERWFPWHELGQCFEAGCGRPGDAHAAEHGAVSGLAGAVGAGPAEGEGGRRGEFRGLGLVRVMSGRSIPFSSGYVPSSTACSC